MSMNPSVLLTIALLPLAAAIVAGLFGKWIGRTAAHVVTIAAVGAAFVLSARVAWQLISGEVEVFNDTVYTWLVSDGVRMEVGFLIDELSVLMMCVVTFVSFCVHVYTIGYMHEDPGYQRFFAYISLFTFAMLMLVMSNNFMQLFFGWEAVGVVSYLLIGFWYTKPSAIFANLKAFLVNRVGDFGFVLGIAAVVYYTGSLDYRDAFAAAPQLAQTGYALTSSLEVSAITLICICLFIGAMGKSAQVPLHVWLPDSMEGPTPISALIHAATMVTAGIFMVARFSPLFEHSEAALSFVLVVGGTTALFMGFLGIVNNDIKRVVAYSTLSQLGYMTVALGASAYGAAIFHLMTHAFFKALLFLAAGSVIIGMHHEQDMRKMGGLGKLMPITAVTCWIGALALIGTPFLSGFYSKDFIIEAVHESTRWGATYAYWCVLLGVFVTAFYTFRMVFMTFHGKPRWHDADPHGEDGHGHGDHDHHGHGGGTPHESPWVVTLPLVLLAIPSLAIGYLTVEPVLFGGYFGQAIQVLEVNDVLAELAGHFHDPASFALSAVGHPPLWLALSGVVAAWYLYLKNPAMSDRLAAFFAPLRRVLDNKYYFDWVNENVFAAGSRALGRLFWKAGDQALIDGALVNGSANLVGSLAGAVRRVQTGYLYSYAFWMMIGLAGLLAWFLLLS
ncbi:MAG: NADH-quinone oxidoreductase subunit L [Gammaproteobacteria bacterium]|nr:NADH-quinone oxidoreductase subunit L [Gammaproteobacteria bacterium]NCW20448.1 NADH-quinone oxidoreductase subunit L [Gammaproteobacteria bacterium]NDB24499.1 NADH-quinone oxidoreductase subunit L [Gammaproteobacteria bacterium]